MGKWVYAENSNFEDARTTVVDLYSYDTKLLWSCSTSFQNLDTAESLVSLGLLHESLFYE